MNTSIFSGCRTPSIWSATIFLICAFGPTVACGFEQDHRINSLTIQFVTDTFATRNAFGGSFVGSSIQSTIQTSVSQNISNGAASLLLTMPGLDDLTGTTDAAFQLGIVNCAPVLPAGNPTAYAGNTDLDWWYAAEGNQVDSNGMALQQITGSITARLLNAGPGYFTFATNQLFSAGQFDLSGVFIRAVIESSSAPLQSTNDFPPGHLASENIAPSLTSFASMSAGQLKGNVSAASLAGIPILSGAVGSGSPTYASTNTLLDLLVSGWKVLGLITEVNPTQPDTSDPNVPVAGAGPPYTFSADSSHSVVTCRDHTGAVVPLADGLKSAAYSAYFKFTSGRVILLRSPSTPLTLLNPAQLPSGYFHFAFTNSPDMPFAVLATTNITLPITNWTLVGSPTQSAAGFYEYTDPQFATQPQLFYRVRSP
jgi:hypothetical protein